VFSLSLSILRLSLGLSSTSEKSYCSSNFGAGTSLRTNTTEFDRNLSGDVDEVSELVNIDKGLFVVEFMLEFVVASKCDDSGDINRGRSNKDRTSSRTDVDSI